MKIIIATKNNGKLLEFKTLLADLPLTITSLRAYPTIGELAETGTSFAENAALKAETVAQLTGVVTLADDSGLEVDILDGRPGIYSARFAGKQASDQENNMKLLLALRGVAPSARTARFRSVIALAQPTGKTVFAEGVCEGLIAAEPQGCGGFGYDPLFFVPELAQTFAQIPAEVKNSISHRARALAAVKTILADLLAENRQRF
ncbi:MAG TPA: XTP/dITP diphosphatase [Oscillospiraceae bacterium]|nr:XTP/dITP diphosphatase [Oscillospiraceae bacterium]